MPYKPPTKAVIPAAGLGTRMLPIAKAVPKEMLPIVDRPAIFYLVEEAVRSGITDVLIITNRDKDIIEDYFDFSPEYDGYFALKPNAERQALVDYPAQMCNIYFIRQKQTRGLGHAVGCARSFVGNEPFAVLYGDDVIFSRSPALGQLSDVYTRWGKPVAGVQRVPTEQLMKYCTLKVSPLSEGIFDVADMIEKPSSPDQIFSEYSILGRVLLTPDIFDIIDATPPGANGEIQLTDAMRVLAQEGRMMAVEYEGRRYDMGSKMGFLTANVEQGVVNTELGDQFKEWLKEFVKTI